MLACAGDCQVPKRASPIDNSTVRPCGDWNAAAIARLAAGPLAAIVAMADGTSAVSKAARLGCAVLNGGVLDGASLSLLLRMGGSSRSQEPVMRGRRCERD
jgi:hypothetical protein